MAATLLESLKKSIGKKKSGSQAFAWLADLERLSGDVDTALQRVDGGLTMYPNDVPAMLVRSVILFAKEDYNGCVQECDKILTADPFCLAAYKRMGDAYDKLNQPNERNKYYRRLHDMDPLNPFWKDEYENVTEDDSILNMTDVNLTMAASEFAGSDLQLSTSDLASTEDFSADAPSSGDSSQFSMFEKSSESSDSSMTDLSFDGTDMSSLSMDDNSVASQKPQSFSDSSDASPEDDIFSSLSALLPNEDSGEEAMMDSLQASLDSAMAQMADDGPSQEEVFPADDDISGSDVSSAMKSMFGDEDDLEVDESSSRPVSPFSSLNLSSAVKDAAVEAPVVEASVEADKPQSVDSAFSSLFGEDEFPEEKPQAQPSSNFEKTADASPVEDKPQSVDSAFDSIFGEDELPEEKPQTGISSSPEEVFGSASDELKLDDSAFEKSSDSAFEKSSDSAFEKSFDSAFEKSSDSAFEKSSDSAFEKSFDSAFEKSSDSAFEKSFDSAFEKSSDSAFEKSFDSAFEKSSEDSLGKADEWNATDKVTKPVEDKPQSVDSAFDSIFGEDELPEEKPLSSSPSSFDDVFGSASDDLKLKDDFKLDDSPVPEIQGNFVEEKMDDAGFEKSTESAFEKSSEESLNTSSEWNVTDKVTMPAADKPQTVDSAFDSIFGEDELPEEKAQAASSSSAEDVFGSAFDDLKLDGNFKLDDSPAPEIQGNFVEEKTNENTDFGQLNESAGASVDNAFDSLFGKDDDLPDENVKESPLATETASFVMGNGAESFAEENTSASIEEQSITSSSIESDLDKSFDSLFGDEDTLIETKKPAVNTPAKENSVDTLESDVSSAFKGLFNMDDDSLDEKPATSNSGVDFLMSGDSDDEISSGLIKDPSAPLNRENSDLDNRLNTRTLAEIYFEQGLYDKALAIYGDLARKEPENQEISSRLSEIEKVCREKFGDDKNG